MLLARAVVADEAHEGEEVVAAARVLLHLLVDPLRDVRGQDLHQGGGRQPPHRVVLDSAPGEVGVGHEGKVIDCPEYDNDAYPHVCGVHSMSGPDLMRVPRFSL